MEMAANDSPVGVTCRVCGRDNPAIHKFCGSCGAALEPQVSHSDPVVRKLHVEDRSASGDFRPAALSNSEYEPAQRSGAREQASPETYDLTLLRSFGSSDAFEEPSPPYLVYAAILLAIGIAVLGFMVWRSSQRRNAQGNSPAQPAATQQEPTNATADTSAPKAAAKHVAHEQNPTPDHAKNTSASAAEKSATSKPSNRIPVAAITPTSNSTGTARDNGSEELATAQIYLGFNGGTRNSAEAAKWLWKSIAKHNGQATLLLADLYLKGDGVSKNCDQARVLLDSAARKGLPGAGDRLRNLQAFNCQ